MPASEVGWGCKLGVIHVKLGPVQREKRGETCIPSSFLQSLQLGLMWSGLGLSEAWATPHGLASNAQPRADLGHPSNRQVHPDFQS